MRRTGVLILAALFGQIVLSAQTPSETSLTATPNPSTYGQPVMLTATVTAGATGKVTFYDGVTVLDVGTISGGMASITTVMLPSGNRKLHAYYQGNGNYAPSSSAAVPQQVVATKSVAFHPFTSYSNASNIILMATGDFNGDGRMDLIAITGYGGSLTVLLGNGDGTFQALTPYPLGVTATALGVGDFNGDGRMDVAIAHGKGIEILLGNGDGTFQSPASYPALQAPSGLAIADFNGDGIADLAVSNGNGTGIAILLGNGDGTFQAAISVPIGGNTTSIATADFNGDGKPDLAVTIQSPASIGILLGNGDGTFQTVQSITTTDGGYSIQTADFNGDGRADLFFGGGNVEGFSVLLGNGDGTFGAPLPYPVGVYPYSLLISDFDGDGNDDVAILPEACCTSSIGIAYGHGDGTFGTAVLYPVSLIADSGAVGDFNGDGRTDLAIGSEPYSNYIVFLGGNAPDLTIAASHGRGFTQGQQGATYTITVTNSGGWPTLAPVGVVASLAPGLTATSISGGGWTCTLATLACSRLDALSAGASYLPIVIQFNVNSGATGNVTSAFSVSGGGETNFSNDIATDTTFLRYPTALSLAVSPNSATLGQAVTFTAATSASATGRVDFYDGALELGSAPIVSGAAVYTSTLLPSGVNSIYAYYAGDSNYGPSTSRTRTLTVNAVASNGILPSNTYPVDLNPLWVGAADVNGDGKADLVTVNAGSNGASISVLLGNGDGTFRKASTYLIGANLASYSSVIGDFNSDGKPDIAVATESGIYVLFGNGDGSFRPGQAVTPSNNCYYLMAADFNGDGIPDLACISGSILLFFGNGDGTFQAPVTIGSGNEYSSLAIADMNGDGKSDLVAGSSSSDSNPFVSVFLGNGDGTFQTPITTSFTVTGFYLDTITVGDFNGDGKPDVALMYWQDVGIMFGNGDGTLQPSIQTALAGGFSYYVVAGDFNGDGKLDIAYTITGLAGVYLALGNGDGTFQSPYGIHPFLASSGQLATADFNGDGKLDFAVADEANNSVDIYLGGQFSGFTVSSTHTGSFIAGQTGTYQITVTDPTFVNSTNPVMVTDTLPNGITATSMSGSGWTCTLNSVTCTRSDWLYNNSSYPVITLTVKVAAGLGPFVISNSVSATIGGTIHSSTDPTTIVPPTTITLSASPNPAMQGQPVTLTATVSSGATGTAMFFQNGNALLSAPVVNGQASISTRLLPTGKNSMVAKYGGDATHGPSSGAISLTVQSRPANGFAPAAEFATGAGPHAVASGDFNRDGKTDLVTVNSGANTISVLLGNGDGTFATNVDYAAGTNPIAVVVADFNNDGRPDIAVAAQNTVLVFLGNGDGTFQPAIPTPLLNAGYLLASDFNNDGIVDLASAGTNYSFTVLTGNGDGTFRQSFYYFNTTVPGEALGDFNGDGNFDVCTEYDLMAGNGDGTFQVNYLSSSSWPAQGYNFASGDLNGDGKPDVVIAWNGGVEVALGNGDGTFQPAVSYPTNAAPSSVLLADINGDGQLDVVMAQQYTSNLSVLLGNGDGTLQPATYVPLPYNPQSAVAGDFNGDGLTDLAVVSPNNNSVTVLLGVLSPALGIASSHAGSFSFGETGATYTITVTNSGPGITSGAITVTDTLPTGMVATAISGAGWNCTLSNLTCTDSASMGVGAVSTITMTVNVTATSSGIVVNQAAVSGGGSASASGDDPTTILGPAITFQTAPAGLEFSIDSGAAQTAPLTLPMATGSHTIAVVSPQAGSPGVQYVFTGWSDGGSVSHAITVGTFSATYTASFQAQYQLTVSTYPQTGGSLNAISGTYYNSGATASLTAIANSPLVFTGWSNGATANPLQLTMNAPASVTAYFDGPGTTCTMTGDATASIADVQYMVNEALGIVPANNDLNGDGVVNITDVQRVANAAMNLGCLH